MNVRLKAIDGLAGGWGMTRIVTIFNGDRAEIRPMTADDIRSMHRRIDGSLHPETPYAELDIPFDGRWHVCRWLGDKETVAPGFDCPAWVENGHLFLPQDGANIGITFHHVGPQAAEGWYDAHSGKRAIARTSALLASTQSGVIAKGPY